MTSKKLGVALAVLLSATSIAFAQASTKAPEDAAPAPIRGISHQGEHARRLYMYAPSGLEQTQPSAPATPTGETAREAALHDAAREAGIPVTRIGSFRAGPPGVMVRGPDGKPLSLAKGGWSHF